jgi:hypothetical protein
MTSDADSIPIELRVQQTVKDKQPTLRNEFDAVVAVLHCTMREMGFICTGHEEKASSDDEFDKQVFAEGWNKSNDSYSFQYKHTQSTMTFIVKYLLMNDKLLVHGLSKEDNKVFSLELSVKEYVTEKIPLGNVDALYKDLDKLISLFKIHITSKLIPNLNKPGYEASHPAHQTQNQTQTQSQTQQQQQPRRDDPPHHHPSYPYDRQGYDPLRVPGSGRGPAFGLGYGDLGYPAPMPGFGIPGGEMGGNLIGPGHPGFGLRLDPYHSDPFGIGGPRLPPGAVPPGARFDPFGPPARPNMPRFPNQQQFGPDNDELPPPGYDNMYL